MNKRKRQPGFTLIELLVVIGIISLLASILMPSLSAARELARASSCQANLHSLGLSMASYLAENKDVFWPYSQPNTPAVGVRCYFWGTDAAPVDPRPSPFMKYCDYQLNRLWCASFPVGSYVPQGTYVHEPTTTYAYNGRYLDKSLNGFKCREANTIPRPSDLFVFADSALSWTAGGVSLFQNSTYLEPVTGNYVQKPTNHFRHRGRTQALCADGHVNSFDSEGWSVDPATRLGFVGTQNTPHYEQ